MRCYLGPRGTDRPHATSDRCAGIEPNRRGYAVPSDDPAVPTRQPPRIRTPRLRPEPTTEGVSVVGLPARPALCSDD
jgi:hypothetical protein